jgi:hypothetical protein
MRTKNKGVMIDCKKNILEFDKINSENISEIRRILSQKNAYKLCDFTFGIAYIWGDYFDGEYCVFRGTVFGKNKNPAFISENADGGESFLLPVGELPIDEAIDILLEYVGKNGEKSLILKCVSEESAEYLRENFEAKVEEMVDFGDYLYSAEALAGLKGHKYNKKRNRVNQFRRNYPNFSFERVTGKNLDRIFELFYKVKDEKAEIFHINRAMKTKTEEWEAVSDDGEQRSRLMAAAEYEARQIEKVLNNFETTGLLYYALFVGERAVAFTVGEVVGDTLYIHIEKADKDYEGAYQAINQLFADEIYKKFNVKYINREDDLGDAGLRWAKTSYYPVEILKKYRAEIEVR